ncbi:chitin deacetylase 8 isoform X2 [Bombyx mori]|uniref:Chitin deacetylase 8 n=1 Tax=Bombyx mori TaxID=7091 RepID=CDA8_BOMMO|nr:chitin deacetylase 8 [Bombyx mori]H9JW43.2 RecName: Full=Chitin deacetylase 8; Short=BmCDA8; AltName: Full=Chitin deacetylase 17; Flags: Precursor [Bombyx mori]
MKRLSVLCSLLLVAAALGTELPLATPCDEEACKLPDCRCSSTNIPGGLRARDTPQFVTVTFDDGINVINIETYREVLYGRSNSNRCPAGATFYVSHEYTNYQLVNELYNRGFEIALHSISHRTPQAFWADATYQNLVQEIGDQKRQMAHFASIPASAIKGVRIPFLQMSGNTSFQVMADFDLLYDCTWPTTALTNPGLWPYTLHHESIQDCIIPPCPTASIPGPWVLPMISWRDLNNFPCSMVDGCFFTPDRTDEEGWFKFILTNFERHYLGNRAPFGFFVHEWFISSNPAIKRAFVRFMDIINNLNDVFMVNSAEVIDWVKNPVPIDRYRQQQCKFTMPSICRPSFCGPLTGTHNQLSYYMTICNTCPRNYPWVGNPLGQ